jgi:hypothetical protein
MYTVAPFCANAEEMSDISILVFSDGYTQTNSSASAGDDDNESFDCKEFAHIKVVHVC